MKYVVVTGGRDYDDAQFIGWALGHFYDYYRDNPKPGTTMVVQNLTIVNGGARGADELSSRWADKWKIGKNIHHADWNLYGIAAGPIRNKHMLEAYPKDSTIVVAFPGGNGTKDCVERARRMGLSVVDYRFWTP